MEELKVKKVLFLTPVFSNLTGGTKYNKNFIEIMINSKLFDVDIKTDKDYGYENGMRWYDSIKTYKSLSDTCSNYDIVIIDSSKCKQLYFYINKIKKQNPKTKFVSIHHHYDFHTQNGLRKLLCKHIELKFLNKMDYIIYASEYTYKLKDKYINKKVKNILLKVPLKQYNSNKTEWVGNQFATIGGTGYGKRKGHHLLVKALNMQKSNLKNFCLKIIGNYSKDDKNIINVENQLKKYNLTKNVVYTGRVSEEDKYSILENSKFYVFPSQYEGYGLSVIEAMSAGLPVIVFNNSAMPTIVKDGETGFLCNSVKEFVKKINILYNDNELCKKMGKNALKYVKTCQTVEEFNNQVMEFITKELKED